MSDHRIIFLWCHLRSISTAFERAFIQRNDVITVHEPFSEPFYVGPERFTKRYPIHYGTQSKLVKSTYAEVAADILRKADENSSKIIFCKDMAHYVIREDANLSPENLTMLDLEFLKKCQHTFLLRDPRKSIRSLYRCYRDVEKNPTLNNHEAGFPQFRILYEFVTKYISNEYPVLVDAVEFVQQPESVMKRYCKAIKIPFEPSMLSWTAGHVPELEKWSEYHKDAIESSEIREKVHEDDSNFPDPVYKAIEEAIPIYEELIKYKI